MNAYGTDDKWGFLADDGCAYEIVHGMTNLNAHPLDETLYVKHSPNAIVAYLEMARWIPNRPLPLDTITIWGGG